MTRGLIPALGIGLSAGGIETGLLAWRRLVQGRLVFVVSDAWWLAPIVTGCLIAATALLLSAPVPRRLELLRVRLRIAVAITLGSLGLILLVPAVSRPAAWLLAIGLGVHLSRWFLRRREALERLARRTTPALLLGPLVAGALFHALPSLRVRLRPLEPAGEVPNVLLIVLDTVRAIELGLYGFGPSVSPNLDALAAQGVVFEQAFAGSSWTAPSHASLFTGRPATDLTIDWKHPLDRRYPTVAEALRQAGYATAGVVGNSLYTSRETGLGRGFDWYHDSHLTPARTLLLSRIVREAVKAWHAINGSEPPLEQSRVPAGSVSRQFLAWIQNRPQRPFFAFLNYYDAHTPYFAPEPLWSRFFPGTTPEPVPQARIPSPPEVARSRLAYRAAIAHLDDEIGRLFDQLLRRGALDNTLVIITADHGEEFFEHGVPGHGYTLYTQSVRVPLIMYWPGHLPAGRRVPQPVGLDRLPATIMDLVGRNGPFAGPSLAGYWKGIKIPPVAVRSSLSVTRGDSSLASVMVGPWRYIHRPAGSTGELYDHSDDPAEQRNLARDPRVASLIRSLGDSLRARPAEFARR
jgi:arylsulfatase A-like enzyme